MNEGKETTQQRLRRAIFFDKDGTLIEDVPHNVNPQRVVLGPRVVQGLAHLQQCGYALFIVSNQPGLAHGIFSEWALHHVLQHLRHMLGEQGIVIDGIYYCPHSPTGTVASYASACTCRKPMPGMLQRAAGEHDIDLRRSWIVGDILHDVEAGHRAGCKAALVNNGNETQWQQSPLRMPDIMVNDVYSAAKTITRLDGLPSPDETKASEQ